MVDVSVTSVLGYNTGKAIVNLKFGDSEIDLESGDASRIGLWLIECATAALYDKCMFELLTEGVGLPVEEAARVIRELRVRVSGEAKS